MLHLQVVAKRGLQRQTEADTAEQQGGSAAVDAMRAQGVFRGIQYRRMRRQSQVVLRREVDAGEGGSVVVADVARAAWRRVRDLAVTPQRPIAARLLPGVEGGDALEQVGSRRAGEILHASRQREQHPIAFRRMVHRPIRGGPLLGPAWAYRVAPSTRIGV